MIISAPTHRRDDLTSILSEAIAAATPPEGVTYSISIDSDTLTLSALYSEDAGPDGGYTDEPWHAIGDIPDPDGAGMTNDQHGLVDNYVFYRLIDEDEDEDEDEAA